jgi:hypothetical protein
MGYNMNYVKNLVKIILLAQCLFLFCACDKKEIVTTEQNRLNLADFVKCPFNEVFDNKTNLEKYVLKKFGKPEKVWKWRDVVNDSSDVLVDVIDIEYENYLFVIKKGVKKNFEVFTQIFILNFLDLKYGINKETTMRDIENLFGQPYEAKIIKRKEKDEEDGAAYYYIYGENNRYVYHFSIGFIKGKLNSMGIDVNINL